LLNIGRKNTASSKVWIWNKLLQVHKSRRSFLMKDHRRRTPWPTVIPASLASRTGWMSSSLHHDTVEAALTFFGAP
jgi:hypothetical protein